MAALEQQRQQQRQQAGEQQQRAARDGSPQEVNAEGSSDEKTEKWARLSVAGGGPFTISAAANDTINAAANDTDKNNNININPDGGPGALSFENNNNNKKVLSYGATDAVPVVKFKFPEFPEATTRSRTPGNAAAGTGAGNDNNSPETGYVGARSASLSAININMVAHDDHDRSFAFEEGGKKNNNPENKENKERNSNCNGVVGKGDAVGDTGGATTASADVDDNIKDDIKNGSTSATGREPDEDGDDDVKGTRNSSMPRTRSASATTSSRRDRLWPTKIPIKNNVKNSKSSLIARLEEGGLAQDVDFDFDENNMADMTTRLLAGLDLTALGFTTADLERIQTKRMQVQVERQVEKEFPFWCTEFRLWLPYSMPSFLFVMGNMLGIWSMMLLGPPLWNSLQSAKILIAALVAKLVLSQKFTYQQ